MPVNRCEKPVMRRLIPQTLRGQLVLIILATFMVVQSISLWLFVDERSLAVRAALGLEAAGRAANVVRLLEAAPEELQPKILAAADSPLARFSLAPQASVDHLDHGGDGTVKTRVQRLLESDGFDHEIRVELHQVQSAEPFEGIENISPEMAEMHRQMMGLDLTSVEMKLAISLQDGQWLNVSTRFHRPPLQWPWVSTVSYGLATLIIMATVWVALSQLTDPLRKLAHAAERFGRGENPADLPAQGPEELRRLTVAFNEMQERLTRFVSERTRLLAALGHDLRSPLTAMRVQSEMVDENETRERLVAIIAEMQEMVDSTLSFARGMVTSEQTRTVDLTDFLDDLVRDIVAIGGDATVETEPALLVRIKPVAMRRALRNVIENAIRYGKSAKITAGSKGKL
ncbi:MAG: HAMP domain-containing protein, partial [Rhodobacteraceae bacterium]|nr:HAMP domain-containing protein [Paracoccaceae bacterium]